MSPLCAGDEPPFLVLILALTKGKNKGDVTNPQWLSNGLGTLRQAQGPPFDKLRDRLQIHKSYISLLFPVETFDINTVWLS